MGNAQHNPYRDNPRRGDWDDRPRGAGQRYQDDEPDGNRRRQPDFPAWEEERDYSRSGRDWGSEEYDERRGGQDRDRMERYGEYGREGGAGRQQGGYGRQDYGFGESDPSERQDRFGSGRREHGWGQGADQERQYGNRFGQDRSSQGRTYGGPMQGTEAYGASAGGERGTRESFRGKGPKGYSRSDDRILEDVNDRLSDDPSIDASEITVKVSGGDVTLEGQVDSRHAKRRAEDCVEECSGVKHVQNNLRVRDASSGDRDQNKTESTAQSPGKAKSM